MNQELKQNFIKAKQLVDDHQSFLLVSHEYTDGDDLGAVLALARVLRDQMGKTVYILAKGGVPDNLLFLPGHNDLLDEPTEEALSAEVLITLGCGVLSRPGFEVVEKWEKPILNIDHHQDSQMFGDVNVWDKEMAANCELLYFMLESWGAKIDKIIAMNILTGIFTDTGGFRHENVRAETFNVAAELLRKGAKLDLISRFTFSNRELPQLRAWAKAIEHAKFDEERQLVYTVITPEELEEVGASEADLDGVVELLNTIPKARYSMLLKQRGDEVKGSLRSETYKGVDVSKIARAFGGGGHKLAAGFKFKGKIEKTGDGWKIT